MSIVLPILERVEDGFSIDKTQEWARNNWTISIYASVIYVTLVFAGRRWMEKRAAYNLRRVLVMWNTGLAVFSIIGSCSVIPSLFRVAYNHGFHHSLCYSEAFFTPKIATWCFLFMLSKLAELGDTFFIVTRKLPLHFLHWYHHITVMTYVWYAYGFASATGHWFGGINYVVHSVMYSYYALRASGRRTPSWVQQCITIMQLSQMFFGLYVNILSYYEREMRADCIYRPELFYSAMLMYTSYAILFMHYFYQAYCTNKKKA